MEDCMTLYKRMIERESAARVAAGKSAKVPADIASLISKIAMRMTNPNCNCGACK